MIIVIGAGIVGTSVAWHLTEGGLRDVVVLDRAPLDAPISSTSLAPGLIGIHDPSAAMRDLARITSDLYEGLDDAFVRVGSIEVARSEPYARALARRVRDADEGGLAAELIGLDDARAVLPDLDLRGVELVGRFDDDGVADARFAQARLRTRAESRGATFRGGVKVDRIEVHDGAVTAVVTAEGSFAADHVVICAGIWGAPLCATAHVAAPIVPMAHPYGITPPLPGRPDDGLATVPFVRDPERQIYVRQHGARYGVGSYRHEPGAADPSAVQTATAAFDEARFGTALDTELIPDRLAGRFETRFTGLFSLTPDGMPIVGPAPAVERLWLAEAVWVTHAGGVGQAVAALLDGREPPVDLTELDPARFAHLDNREARRRAIDQYRHIYARPTELGSGATAPP